MPAGSPTHSTARRSSSSSPTSPRCCAGTSPTRPGPARPWPTRRSPALRPNGGAMATTPLTVLDLVPISSGSSPAEALQNTIALARATESFGYYRYWFAEHRLNPGVAGTSPAVVLALTAAATSRIRIGSGAVQLGHRTALSTVEEFGLIDALHPGRLDLGLGRSGGRPAQPYIGEPPPATAAANGLRNPPRFAVQRKLLQLPNAEPQDYGEQIDDILALLRGRYVSADGVPARAVPGEGAQVQV